MPPSRSSRLFSTLDLVAASVVGALLLLAAAAVVSARGWKWPGDAGFWGSIVGAVVGGSIALVGQWITILDARQSRRDEQATRDRAHGTAFVLKLARVFNDLNNIDRFFAEAFDNERARAPGVEPWTVYRPATYYPDPVLFTTDELSILVATATAELTALCLGLDERHNALLAGLSKIDELRNALVATLEPESVSGIVASGRITLSARQRADMNLINALLSQSRATCNEDLAQACKAMVDVSALFRRVLGMTIVASPP